MDFGEEIMGKNPYWIPMEAANCVMVRTNKNMYVADKYVRFYAAEIDKAIAMLLIDNYMPLKFFTTFATFPDCKQEWNLFVLESYCRGFSEKFRFDTMQVNSRNIGAVIRKSCKLSYTEIMTDAVVKANVSLDKARISEFLYVNGYVGKRTVAKASEILNKARDMERRQR
jgi:hypothetical protein